MTVNISDAKNSALGAVLDLEKVMNEFQANWIAPDVQRSQAILAQILLNQWNALKPEINQVAQQNPEAYKNANQAIQKLRGMLAGKQVKGG